MSRAITRLALMIVGSWCVISNAQAQSEATPPNVVIIFLDDSGWADFRPFAEPAYPTPNVEQLAREGCHFDNFYVPQAVCSASRAALMTGCYPGRTRVFGAHPPRARGLDPQYATLGQVLGARGYATAVFGKWHLGDQPETRPPARGFDESCGLMYSNDMWEFHPENPDYWGKFPLQFWENGKVTIERITSEHQPMLTKWYTQHAVDFIQRHKDKPFLLYVPHSMPHVPIFCSEEFRGKSGVGLYGDVMMELDWSVGQITKALKDAGVEENTLVIFSSDNGPWISYGNHAGKTPFREAKGTGFDGGIRSACIMKFPGRIQAGTRSTQRLLFHRSAANNCPRDRRQTSGQPNRRPERVGSGDRHARGTEPAGVLPVLNGRQLRGNRQRRRALETTLAARLPDAGDSRYGWPGGEVRAGAHRTVLV